MRRAGNLRVTQLGFLSFAANVCREVSGSSRSGILSVLADSHNGNLGDSANIFARERPAFRGACRRGSRLVPNCPGYFFPLY
jgi:hypothetical protein